MTRKFCDRCDMQCETLTDVVVEVPQQNTLEHELCPRCWRQLVDFFKPLPKVEPAPEQSRK